MIYGFGLESIGIIKSKSAIALQSVLPEHLSVFYSFTIMSRCETSPLNPASETTVLLSRHRSGIMV